MSESDLQSSPPRNAHVIRFLESQQAASDSDSSYAPTVTASSRPQSPSDMAVRCDEKVQQCLENPAVAQAIVARITLSSSGAARGWCVPCTLVPSKKDGYIQVSSDGANHFACLQDVLCWSQGLVPQAGDQASHLCGLPSCLLPEHVVYESELLNQRRKGCVVWVDCPHCSLKIMACQHLPRCVKFCPGYNDQVDFLARGIH